MDTNTPETEQKPLEEQLKELEEEKDALSLKLHSLHLKIKQLRVQLVHRDYGVTKGTVVYVGKDIFRVSEIEFPFSSYEGKPWLKGNIRKKDGSWGTAERNLFTDWEIYKEQE